MASLGHVAIGLAAGRLFAARAGAPAPSWRSAVFWSALSLLPDLDVIGFAARIPYGAPFGHRGASHALLVAAAIGAVAALLAPKARWPALRTGVFVATVVGSHGVLDAMTDGGKGIALAWPFSSARMFLPWRPIPVAPVGVGLLSARGLEVVLTELVYFAPILLWALWPRTRRGFESNEAGATPEPEETEAPASGDDVVVVPIEDSIDLHTFAPRDVASVVDEYLREAARKGLSEVRVIHGKGKGVQRRIVEGVLSRHPDVVAFRTAPGTRGGWGATLVTLRGRGAKRPH